MILNKTWKVIIGLLTAMTILGPFIYMAIVFAMMGQFIFMGDPSQLSEQEAFRMFQPMFYIMPVIMLGSVVQMGTSIFYLVHVIMNKAGTDVLRILLGVGVFLLPYIAMPFYYFVYIWPETPAEWALVKQDKEN